MADAILPIQLTSFTANKQGSTVQLNWVTTAETNNKGFAIEKKGDEIINHLGGNTLHKIPFKGIQTKEVYHVVIRDESGGLRLDKLLMRAL